MQGVVKYRRNNHPVTSTLTTQEFQQLAELANEAGLAPTTYATKIIREKLKEEHADT